MAYYVNNYMPKALHLLIYVAIYCAFQLEREKTILEEERDTETEQKRKATDQVRLIFV